jgi:hypothetical protein
MIEAASTSETYVNFFIRLLPTMITWNLTTSALKKGLQIDHVLIDYFFETDHFMVTSLKFKHAMEAVIITYK